jgi:hypothetical protein
MSLRTKSIGIAAVVAAAGVVGSASAQLHDVTQNPDIVGVPGHPGDSAGIGISYDAQKGTSPDDHGSAEAAGKGSSAWIIARDPGRAVRRGRQLFQRKFEVAQGFGPLTDDGVGSTGADLSRSAGLADSCAACHGRPRGSAGFGGDVATRPDSRDAPHLFGLGLQEMLGDEITAELRAIRDRAIRDARRRRHPVSRKLVSKGIDYGVITAHRNGKVDTSRVVGVNADLRVRPFFAQGGTVSMREFIVGALNAEMGLESPDTDLIEAQTGQVITPAGMVLNGAVDFVENAPVSSPSDDADGDGVTNEVPVSIIDFMEFYLLNYFKAGTGRQTKESLLGRALFSSIGCSDCHKPNLTINHDRRVADVETVHNPADGNPLNNMFATASLRVVPNAALPAIIGTGTAAAPEHPQGLSPSGASFVVRNFFADLKRHDLGPNFHERNYVGNVAQVSPLVEPPHDPVTNFTTLFITEPLWGVGDTPSYGHDGRSGNLRDVILRHGGEASRSRNLFARLSNTQQVWVQEFLRTLVLFSPDDTASNLRPVVPTDPLYPQVNHGSIALGAIFTTAGAE